MKMTRQEASKIIEQYRMCSSGDCPTLECADCEYNHDPRKVEEAFLMAIDALESAQPERRRIGKWIIRTEDRREWYRVACSACGEDVTATIPLLGSFPYYKALWSYCPECGADMQGGSR